MRGHQANVRGNPDAKTTGLTRRNYIHPQASTRTAGILLFTLTGCTCSVLFTMSRSLSFAVALSFHQFSFGFPFSFRLCFPCPYLHSMRSVRMYSWFFFLPVLCFFVANSPTPVERALNTGLGSPRRGRYPSPSCKVPFACCSYFLPSFRISTFSLVPRRQVAPLLRA